VFPGLTRTRRSRLLIALVAAVGTLAFARAVWFDFVYDDHWTIRSNAALDRSLAPILRAAFTGSEATRSIPDSTRPAMMLSMWVDRRLFGDRPAGYHAHSLLLYAVCCGLATWVLFGITRRARSALAGGVFFALTPLHAEVAAAINYREDLIAALGVLTVLGCLFAPRSAAASLDAAILAAAGWGIALLGKESAVALLPAVFAVALARAPGRRWFSARRNTWVALVVVLVAFSVWRAMIRWKGVDDVPLAPTRGGLETALATARYAVKALAQSLFPFTWSPEYARPGPASAWWAAALVGCVAAIVLMARRRATRLVAAGAAFALLTALPTSPLVGPANEFADRYLVLPSLGGAMVWAWAAERLTRRLPLALRPALVALAAIPFAIVAGRAAAPWASDLALWTEAARRAPDAPRSWVGLSRAQRLAGDPAAAEVSIDRALTLEPRSAAAGVTRAYLWLDQGKLDAARRELERLRALGASKQRGFARASNCAALDDAKAASDCIRAE
jgi:protein O-mannosyl-transferase